MLGQAYDFTHVVHLATGVEFDAGLLMAASIIVWAGGRSLAGCSHKAIGWIRTLLVALPAMLASACAITPPVATADNMCNFTMPRVETQRPQPVAQSRVFGAPQPKPQSILLLSGGGEDGAFGAGLLQEWHNNAGRLPRFDIVTGISTGAMLATFAFIDQPAVAVDDYDIKQESDILKAFAKVDAGGNPTLTSYPSILKHDALGDLTPLQAKLEKAITFEVLQAVAKDPDRKLYVGAVDVDSGDAVEFDMTAMAAKAVASKAAFETYRPCYIKAIIASASEPPAAPPIFIDNREYIDGGARFGVFLDGTALNAGLTRGKAVSRLVEPGAAADAGRGVQAASADAEPDITKLPLPPTIFILVNGDQKVFPECGKLDIGNCKNGIDASNNLPGAHKNWSLLPLALRSSEVLINQIYLFSVADIYARYAATYGADLAHQSVADHIKYMAINDADLGAFPEGGNSCAQRRVQDTRNLRVLEFHPNYMHCLIQYGEHYADLAKTSLNGE